MGEWFRGTSGRAKALPLHKPATPGDTALDAAPYKRIQDTLVTDRPGGLPYLAFDGELVDLVPIKYMLAHAVSIPPGSYFNAGGGVAHDVQKDQRVQCVPES